MKVLLGEKIGMTQVFDSEGRSYPATVVKTGSAVITQVKTLEKDGYCAIQIGYGEIKPKSVNKPQIGHFKNLSPVRFLKEVKISPEEISKFKTGDKIELDVFSEGDKINVSATSKSKGFQGVVKRHGFSGGPRTHGQKHSEREAGSIGGGGRAGGRVVKGMRMAGRTGGDRITVKNLSIVAIKPEENYVVIGGAIPGRKGTFVEVYGI